MYKFQLIDSETRPVEYTKQILKILNANSTMLLRDLINGIGKTSNWIYDRLLFLKLDPSIQKLVKANKLRLLNAWHLAKLPMTEQNYFIDQALVMDSFEFYKVITAKIKELLKVRREEAPLEKPLT